MTRPALRPLLLTVLGTILGLCLLIALTWRQVRADRDELLGWFGDQRQTVLLEAARRAQEGLEDIVGHLRFAGRIVQEAESPAGRAQALGALLGSVRPYQAIAVYGPGGELEMLVTDPRRDFVVPEDLRVMMDRSAQAVLGDTTGRTETSLPGGEDNWFRALAQALPEGRGAIALLVDFESVLEELKLITADSTTWLLVLGPHGRPQPISHPEVVELMAAPPPGLADALGQMRRGEPGIAWVEEPSLRESSLGTGDLVLCYTPIGIEGVAPWLAATLSSTAPLQGHLRAVAWRIGLTSAGVGALLLLLGGYGLLGLHRAERLQQRLRHATEMAALQASLLRAEKLSTVGVLAAGIAHEVGTPLGVIRGRAELTMRRLGEEHPQAASLRIIVEQIDRVARTIGTLLDFSRVKPAVAAPTALGPMLQRVAVLLETEAQRRKVHLRVAPPDEPIVLAASADQLEQALINLLMNALDACEPGGRVWLRSEVSEGRARITIADDGRGIPAELQNQVFDPFFTTKKRGQGTGLGLAMVSQIARSHGAQIELESEEGRGTRATLLWPLAGGEESDAGADPGGGRSPRDGAAAGGAARR